MATDWEKLLTKKHEDQLKRWISDSKSLKILVTGQTGAGKSALVNGIVGQYVAEEGGTLDPATSRVTEYYHRIGEVDVVIFDSPGLQDGTSNEDKYLEDMETKCRQIDLVLYCTKMDAPRLGAADIEAIRKLTSAFGTKFWHNAVFVLTFANKVEPPPRRQFDNKPWETDADLRTYFIKRVAGWAEKLRVQLTTNGVSEEVADQVTVVPAGYYMEPALPDCEHWLSQLWFECLDRTAEQAKPALLKINWTRMRMKDQVRAEELKKAAYEQPILYPNDVTQSVSVPPFILELLGLPPQIGNAGKCGAEVGSAIGKLASGYIGLIGPQMGGMAGAIIGELMYHYAIQYFK